MREKKIEYFNIPCTHITVASGTSLILVLLFTDLQNKLFYHYFYFVIYTHKLGKKMLDKVQFWKKCSCNKTIFTTKKMFTS